ncbi:hypothetical protein F4824DRAFT_512605 [Ustulina deusta]|nr:hypothetical protein F4823DRAFT_640096 [Ustulina deusta]KAI3334013.1 hypothetical protein F4824DRAFT_512605 [Ustulina deusta]
MRLERQEEKVAIKVKTFFAEEPNYVFEKVAGTGAFGVTLCFRNEHAEPNDHRTIAVKAATWSNQDIGTEIKSLEPLIWAQHIVTIIKIPFKSNETRWMNDNTIITEYLENGTLMNLKRRLGENYPPRKLPNRILWAMFLCLVRGCIGMAYPPGNLRKTPRGPRDQLLETLPRNSNARPPSKLEHGDLHEANIMIGDFDPIEHRWFPVLKFIDFGLANEIDNAVAENILAIGEVMCGLIWASRDITQLVNDKKGANILDRNLDSELLMLVAQCIETDPASRPSLSRLLSVIHPKLRQTYPNIPEESDHYISQLVQKYILDAA